MAKHNKEITTKLRNQSKKVVSSICKFTLKVNYYRKKEGNCCKRSLEDRNKNSPHNTTQYLLMNIGIAMKEIFWKKLVRLI